MRWRDDTRGMTDADRAHVDAFREFLRRAGQVPSGDEKVVLAKPEYDYAHGAITSAEYLELRREK